MAHIFYPSDAETYIRTVSGSNLLEFHVTAGAGLVFYLTGSTYATASTSASYALTSSFATSASWAPGGTAGHSIVLCSAFTPTVTGADVGELSIPYSPIDGVTSITWNVRKITFRVNTSGGSPAISIEKYTANNIFNPTKIEDVTMSLNAYEVTKSGLLGTVNSGDKVRFNVGDLGTAQNWNIITEISNG